MKTIILATYQLEQTGKETRNKIVTIYPEVIVAIGGEIHEGMFQSCSISINPNAEEYHRIKITSDNNLIIPYFDFLSSSSDVHGLGKMTTIRFYVELDSSSGEEKTP